jgi:hypothetical protein
MGMTSVFAESRHQAALAMGQGSTAWRLPSWQQVAGDARAAVHPWRQRINLDRARSLVGWRSSQALVGRRYTQRGLRIETLATPEPDLATLQARDGRRLVGTLSVRLDGPNGLAADGVFPDEVAALRAQGWRLCECTRLAVDTENPSKAVLAGLFHLSHLYGHRVRNANLAIMEVHPRHAPFYRRMLDAKVIASGRDNPSVQAPSVLMSLDLAHFDAQMERFGGQPELADSTRTLFPYGYGPAEVPGLIERLRAEI